MIQRIIAWYRSRRDPYLVRGRLANVIAAVQVMASAERPERTIKDWAQELDRDRGQQTIDRWTKVFREHREFFLVYTLPGQDELKAALRWRYVNKLYDSKTGEEFTPAEKSSLPKEQQDLLTTKPLAGDQVSALMSAAIELHSRAIEALGTKRWWIPLFTALLGAAGAIAGALVAAYLKLSTPLPT